MQRVLKNLDQLKFDPVNPRIEPTLSDREALQNIVELNVGNFVELTMDIAKIGLNPAELFYIIEDKESDRFIVVEGNRRLSALKTLNNPHILTGIEAIGRGRRRKIQKEAEKFDLASIEPIMCVLFDGRQAADGWIERRHTREQGGKGLVSWDTLQSMRFRETRDGKPRPAYAALKYAFDQMSEEERQQFNSIKGYSTFERFMDDRDARSRLGLELKNGQMHRTHKEESVKTALLKLARDIADGEINTRKMRTKSDRSGYLNQWGQSDLPQKAEVINPVSLDSPDPTSIAEKTPTRTRRTRDPNARPKLTKKSDLPAIDPPKIAKIFIELTSLIIDKHPHAIGALLRVFFELSVDHYLSDRGLPLSKPGKKGNPIPLPLRKRLIDARESLVGEGCKRSVFAGAMKEFEKPYSVLSTETLNAYIHDATASPSRNDLITAWDSALPLIQALWSKKSDAC